MGKKFRRRKISEDGDYENPFSFTKNDEVSWDPEKMDETFRMGDEMWSPLTPEEIEAKEEKFQGLVDKGLFTKEVSGSGEISYKSNLLEILKGCLTEKQYNIFEMRNVYRMKEIDIAKKLGIKQCVVSLTLKETMCKIRKKLAYFKGDL